PASHVTVFGQDLYFIDPLNNELFRLRYGSGAGIDELTQATELIPASGALYFLGQAGAALWVLSDAFRSIDSAPHPNPLVPAGSFLYSFKSGSAYDLWSRDANHFVVDAAPSGSSATFTIDNDLTAGYLIGQSDPGVFFTQTNNSSHAQALYFAE